MTFQTSPRVDPVTPRPEWSGTVLEVFVAEMGGVEMHAVDAARLIPGKGIEGDRYATQRGHYSHLWHPDRQVTMIASEVIASVSESIGEALSGQETRRNIVTRDVPLNDLVGSYFGIGETVLYGGRLNIPCKYLERLIDKKVFDPLVGRSGLNCQIIRGGIVYPGDTVRPLWDWDEAQGRAVV